MVGTVCGGFLGWDALAALARLGVDPMALGARPIGLVRIVVGTRAVEVALPGPAAGLSRAALDEALLRAAAEAGARVERGCAIRRVDEGRVILADGTAIAAETLFVATGKHGLRGAARGSGKGSLGLRTTLPAPPDLVGVIELHLFRDGYAGLLLQEDGAANLCLSIAPARFAACGGRPEALIVALAAEAPRLADRAAAAIGRWDSIAAVPYGWRALSGERGRFRIGDQAAVIASLVGDGVAIALASGGAAASACLAGEDGSDWQARFAARAAPPLRLAELARAAAGRPRVGRALLPWIGRAPGLLRLLARATRIGH